LLVVPVTGTNKWCQPTRVFYVCRAEKCPQFAGVFSCGTSRLQLYSVIGKSEKRWTPGRGQYGRGRGHNKGTITVTMRASKRQKEPSIALIFYKLPVSSVTAEVAGSSPVVPAIHFQKTYGTYGPKVTWKSGFDMGAIRVLPPILREFFILHFTQIWNHHLNNLALCCPLVRTHCLCVHIERNSAIRVP
jgi:hypothetical protein